MSAIILVAAAQPSVDSASLGPALFQLFGILGVILYILYDMNKGERVIKDKQFKEKKKQDFWASKNKDEKEALYYLKKEATRDERYRVAQEKFEASLLQDAEDRKSYFKRSKNDF